MGRAHEVRKVAMEKTSLQKSKVYSRFGKEIYMIAKQGGPDPDINVALKRIIERAKQAQVPQDVIKRNIEKSQQVGGEDYFPVRYEGFGPGGSTIIVECISDNVNRTVSEVRNCFTKTGGNLGVQGSVTYQYQHVSYIELTGLDEDSALETLMMAEIDIHDIQMDDDVLIIIGDSTKLDEIKECLKTSHQDIEVLTDKVIWLANNKLTLEGEAKELFNKFMTLIEDVEDVQEVHHNVE